MRFNQAAVLLFSLAVAQASYAKMPDKDTVKGQDHRILSRFQGALMVGHGLKEFDEVNLFAGKREKGVDKFQLVEGKYTRIAYNYPQERSSLEVMRSYQAALDKAGLKTVFACVKEECGKDFGDSVRSKRLDNNFIVGSETASPFNYGRDHVRYVLAKGTLSDGVPVHVAVYVVDPVSGKNGGIYVEVVEAKPMETGKVAANLSAGDMAKAIAADGRIAIYGVYFDTGKAEVKPDSKAALAEMAKLLQADPALKVHVVGHTDSQGSLAANVDLSQKRAESVVKSLSGEYKIDPKRLSAKGVASYAPVASNDSDGGRDKNRRVELVKQ